MDLYGDATSLSELQELNDSLSALAAVFPNVRPEVFREMLTTLSRESRTQVVAEHLLRSGDKWIKGRWRVDDASRSPVTTPSEAGWDGTRQGESAEPGSSTSADGTPSRDESSIRIQVGDEFELVPLSEKFRSPSYKAAVFTALRHEFTSLSKSTINGVLAEQNYSYTLSRPVLTDLASKTLRSSITNFVMRAFGFGSGAPGGRGRNAPPPDETHFMLLWSSINNATSSASTYISSSNNGSSDKTFRTPYLKPTGSSELDLELYTTVLQPLLLRRRQREDKISLELALLLNEHEAEQAGAMYECQVCFGDAAWEQIAICTGSEDAHVICFECLQRSVSEAVYGQSWDLSIDHARGQVACLAPASSPCDGCIPRELAERAIISGKGGEKMWGQLQSKLADESLYMSGAALVRCPFCAYAELDELYLPRTPSWHLNLQGAAPLRSSVLLLLTLITLLFLSFFYLLYYFLFSLPLSYLLRTNTTHGTTSNASASHSIRFHLITLLQISLLSHARNTHRPNRFLCKSPHCRRASCLSCRRAWRDPHHCYEADALSLRTTIEAARTAALKRTCPRCGVSFVKASGCNKMVCVCGYVMCYVCRMGLKGRRNSEAGGRADGGLGVGEGRGAGEPAAAAAAAAENNNEGYRHFCQHFRPTGGKCTECDRCDLYRAEDEDEAVRRAGEAAEREWRARNGVELGVEIPIPEGDGVVGRNAGGRVGASASREGNAQVSGLWQWWMWWKKREWDVDAAIQRMLEWWIGQVLVSRLPATAEDRELG